jgi:DNA-binding transcriptional regulator YdaS (Cro superfamily)
MARKPGIELAVKKFDGSASKLAQAIGGKVVRQNVESWLKSGRVPANHAPDVMVATGIPVDRLCPGTNWDAVRNFKAA